MSALSRLRSSRAAKRAYTMVEVMAAMAVLTVGASGVIAMQKTTQLGNVHARNLAAANAVTSTWIERLRADALMWNNPNGVPDINDTTWVKQVANGSAFFSPAVLPGTASNAADLQGADVFPGDAAAVAFCTHISLTQISPTTITATVRTVWSRSGRALDCNMAPNTVDLDGASAHPIGFGGVYVTTAIGVNATVGS